MADESKQEPKQTEAQRKLGNFVKQRYDELAFDRMAEDADWYLSGRFAGGQQWFKRDSNKRLVPINPSDNPTWTMPVSDHFSKTIAVNATALGAVLPRTTAVSGNYDARNRRAASYAEAAIDVAMRESGMDVLNAILAIQTVLWGVGIAKNETAFDHSTQDVPIIAEQTPEGVQEQPVPEGQLPTQDPAQPGSDALNQQTGQPTPDPSQDPNVVGTERVPSARLKCTLPTPFNVYIPRDCGDPNISKECYERVTWKLSEARAAFPDWAGCISADSSGEADAATGLAYWYLEQLRRMGVVTSSGATNSSTKDATKTVEKVRLVEGWVGWGDLDKDLQDEIEKEWGDQPSEVEDYAKQGMTRLSAAVAYGLFAITYQSKVLQWGENPMSGDLPYTFFMWEKGVANPYGRGGLGNVLRPLQRQLNRLDALHDRSLMSNGTTKIMMPESQQYNTMSGDPVDIYTYDDMAGKHPPQLFPAGRAPEIPAKRAQIVQEFQELGYTEGVQSGQAPSGATAFRAIAYLGAKAEEQRGTQRALWEGSHEILARKMLRDAKRVWNEPRKLKVAGPNNRYGAELIEGADLDFETDQLTIVQGSSRPKTLAEKEEAFNTLVSGGLVDVTDPDVRQFVYDTIGMPELSLANSLQYSKAERDLQQVIDSVQPVSVPNQDWAIVQKVFGAYMLTEEYEALDQGVQAGILGYWQWAGELQQPVMPPMGPDGITPMDAQQAAGGQLPGQHPGQTLSKVPGKSATTQNTEKAATAEGNSLPSAVEGTPAPVAT